MDDIAIWRTAQEMMKLYGQDAEFKAGLRADRLLELGDTDGFHVWKRISAAIVSFTGPKAGCETIH